MEFVISERELRILLAHITRRRRDDRLYKPTYALQLTVEGEQLTCEIVREEKQNRKE